MSGGGMFLMLLLTVLMTVSGVREISQQRYAMGVTLIAIPACGWIALMFGRVA